MFLISSRLTAVFAQSIEARCQVHNEDVVGAAPTGDAPTTSEWSIIVFSTKVRFILEIRFMSMHKIVTNVCYGTFALTK